MPSSKSTPWHAFDLAFKLHVEQHGRDLLASLGVPAQSLVIDKLSSITLPAGERIIDSLFEVRINDEPGLILVEFERTLKEVEDVSESRALMSILYTFARVHFDTEFS